MSQKSQVQLYFQVIFEMQRGLPVRLTYTSRVLLYSFKKFLILKKLTLQNYLTSLFNSIKVKFQKQEFIRMFKLTNKKLHPLHITKLFQELDVADHEIVFFDVLKEALFKVNHRDNPEQEYNDAEEYKKVSQKELLEIYKDIIILLGESKQTLQILQLLLISNQGKITKSNIQNIFKNINYQDHFKQTIFLQSCFEHHSKISIGFLLKKFDKLHSEQLNKYKEIQQEIQQETQTVIKTQQKIEEKQKEQKSQSEPENDHFKMIIPQRIYKWTDEELKYLKGQIQFDQSENIPPNKISQHLKPFINEQNSIEPLFAQIATKHLIKNLDFADKANPINSKAISRIHITSKFHNAYYLFNEHEDFILKQKIQNYVKQLINPKDIAQGNVGNCYFLTGIIGFVEKYPEYVHKLFILKKNPAHLYGVRLFVEGKWKTIMMDASFPLGREQTFCCSQPRNREIWVMLLEKAWAKVYGSYDAIDGGSSGEGLTAMSGAPSQRIPLYHSIILRVVLNRIRQGAIVSCGSSPHLQNLTLKEQKTIGIIAGHAYSLLDVIPAVETIIGKQTLIKLRNPWGQTQWQGDWNFSSSFWTEKLRKQFNYESYPKDGSFYMCLKDFMQYFSSVSVCPINFQNKNSYVEFKDSNLEFQTMNIVIKKKGIYSFTIYQENPRKYEKNQKKDKEKAYISKSWLFLLQSKYNKKTAIKARFIDSQNNTITVQLEPGPYILFAKIQWQSWQKHNFTVSSYGPQKLKIKKLDKWNVKRLEQYIESQLFEHQEKQYEEQYCQYCKCCKKQFKIPKKQKSQLKIINKSHLNYDQGYGFYYLKNLQNFTLQLSLKYNNMENIDKQSPGYSVLAPHQLPLQRNIKPKEQVFLKFLVHDPFEHRLNLEEKITPIIQF